MRLSRHMRYLIISRIVDISEKYVRYLKVLPWSLYYPDKLMWKIKNLPIEKPRGDFLYRSHSDRSLLVLIMFCYVIQPVCLIIIIIKTLVPSLPTINYLNTCIITTNQVISINTTDQLGIINSALLSECRCLDNSPPN